MKKGKIVLFIYLISISAFGQYSEIFKRHILLAEKTNNYYEGFNKSSGSNDFIYHSFREDVSESMLTRCTDGSHGSY